MKTKKSGWMAAALAALAVAAAVPAQAFTRGERATAAAAAEEAKARMAGAAALQGKAVTLLPVHGDEDGCLEARLLDAGIQAGFNMVVANDTQDARFRRILREIRWDEDQKRLETVDPETIDELGHLLSTQVLLEGRVTKGRKPAERDRRGRPAGFAGEDGQGAVEMEVELFAYEIQTKRYSWSAILSVSEPPPAVPEAQPREEEANIPPPVVVQDPLNIGVETKAGTDAERVADDVDTWVQGRLADQGYRLKTGKKDDLTLSLEVEASRYDVTGEWETWKGAVKAALEAKGAEARLVGTADFPSKGKPGIGPSGERNLAYAMEEQLGTWLKRTLDPDALGFVAEVFAFMLVNPLELGEDFVKLERLRKTIAGMDGVRRVELYEQDDAAGMVSYRVVYETAAYPGGLMNALLAAHPELLEGTIE